MQGDGFDHGHGQTPQSQQIAAGFRVRGAKNFAFRFEPGNVFGGREVGGRVAFVGKIRRQHHPAHVVQHSGGEGFVDRMWLRSLGLGDEFGAGAGLQAVLPERFDGEAFDPRGLALGNAWRLNTSDFNTSTPR